MNRVPDFVPATTSALLKETITKPVNGRTLAGRLIETIGANPDLLSEAVAELLLSKNEQLFQAECLSALPVSRIESLSPRIVAIKTHENAERIVAVFDAAIRASSTPETKSALQRLRGNFLHAEAKLDSLQALFERYSSTLTRPLTTAELETLYALPENQQKSWFSTTPLKEENKFIFTLYSRHEIGPFNWMSSTHFTASLDRLGQIRLVDDQKGQQIFSSLQAFEEHYLNMLDSIGTVSDRLQAAPAHRLSEVDAKLTKTASELSNTIRLLKRTDIYSAAPEEVLAEFQSIPQAFVYGVKIGSDGKEYIELHYVDSSGVLQKPKRLEISGAELGVIQQGLIQTTPEEALKVIQATLILLGEQKIARHKLLPLTSLRTFPKTTHKSPIEAPNGAPIYSVKNELHTQGRRAAQCLYFKAATLTQEEAFKRLSYIFNTHDKKELIQKMEDFTNPKLTLEERGLGPKFLKNGLPLGIPKKAHRELTWQAIQNELQRLKLTANLTNN